MCAGSGRVGGGGGVGGCFLNGSAEALPGKELPCGLERWGEWMGITPRRTGKAN